MPQNALLIEPAPHAPQPAPPQRQYSFTDFQTNNPSGPLPGDRIDGEYDRSNQAVADVIAWVEVSLNSDGSLKPQSVGEAQLTPGLFDHIGADAQAAVEPMLETARDLAVATWSAANAAGASADAAARQSELARQAADRAALAPLDSASDARDAASSAAAAAASAAAAANSASNADGSEAVCVDYGVLTQAWAEHMPDTIPPNILAVMDVTGDHWSSRWWANQAHIIVENETQEAICDLQAYWLGAYSSPPTVNSCGEPVVAGAMYYDLTAQRTKVYDGALWRDVIQPVPGNLDFYQYLPTTPISVFTGVDHNGKTLTFNPANTFVDVYLNGVKLLQGLDYSLTTNTVTLLSGSVGSPNTVEVDVATKLPTSPVQPAGVKVNTNPWVFDGTTKTFPLADGTGTTVNPPGSVDCIVSLNGVIQEAGGDFTTRPGFIDFIVAPEADADRWMVVGLPLGGALAAADTAGFEARIAQLEARIVQLEVT
jgi:hypothetical protein